MSAPDMPGQWRGCIAGTEVSCRSARADVLAAMIAPWIGYESRGGAPDVIADYVARDGFALPSPTDRPYPAFACEAGENGALHLWRHDARGVIETRADGVVSARFEGLPARHSVETMLRLALSVALPRAGGLLLHSSGVILNGRAILFSGESGAGKSTIAGLLAPRQKLGDDLTAVRPVGGRFHAHATPFAGEAEPAADGAAPLGALCFLVQSDHHALHPMTRPDALRRVMRNLLAYVAERDGAARTLAAAAALVAAVPVYVLEFARDAGVAAVLERAGERT